jgi:hypothetical protein
MEVPGLISRDALDTPSCSLYTAITQIGPDPLRWVAGSLV